MSALHRLAGELRDEGGLLAEAVVDPAGTPEPHGDAAGERYALIVEAIREGYLEHYAHGSRGASRRS